MRSWSMIHDPFLTWQWSFAVGRLVSYRIPYIISPYDMLNEIMPSSRLVLWCLHFSVGATSEKGDRNSTSSLYHRIIIRIMNQRIRPTRSYRFSLLSPHDAPLRTVTLEQIIQSPKSQDSRLWHEDLFLYSLQPTGMIWGMTVDHLISWLIFHSN